MSTELAAIDGRMALARQLADSDMIPASYRKKPGNVMWAIAFGEAMGVAPVVAMGMVHVIEGKPSASALMLAGLVRKAGHRLRVESDDTRAVATVARSDDPEFWFKAEFSMVDAGKAGVLGNPNWKKWPRNMMEARAISAVARKACSEVLLGVDYITEELGGDPSPDDLPSGATVSESKPTGPERWSDTDRVTFCAALGNIGLKYNDVAAWCESIGRPRPSVMGAKQRGQLMAAVAGASREKLDAWIAAQAPAPVDAEFAEPEPEPFFDAPPAER